MKKETSKKGTFVRSSLLLPLLAILLFGFSETKTVVKEKDSALKPNRFYLEGSSNRTIEVAGLVLDSKTLFPLANVKLYNENGKIISTTDSKGYYQIKFNNLAEGEVFFQFTLNKIGYKPFQQKEHWGNLNGKIKSSIVIGLQKKESSSPEFSELFTNTQDLSYESIQEKLFLIEKQHKFNQKLEDAKNGNQNIYFEIDYTSYLVSNSGWIKINSKNDLISIDDNRNILAFQLNGILERKQITGMTPLEGYEDAFFGVYTTTKNINTKRKSENLDFKLKSYNSLAKKYNAIPIEKRIISIKDLRVLETIYREMTEEQKRNAQPFPECLPKNKQNGASREQIAEYNKLAKHYNEMSSDHMRIIKKDVERLKYIYGLMSEKQKTSAQPLSMLPQKE